MELRHLRYFVAVAEELNFSRAALRLHIGQPPLSMQIRALEEEIGARLIERNTRRVVLTEAGKGFLGRARAILAEAALAAEEARRAARGESGELRIGFTASMPYTSILADGLHAYRQRYPGVQLQLREMFTTDQFAALAADTLDVGLVRSGGIGVPPGIVLHPIGQDPLRVVIPVDHPLAARERIAFAELRDEGFILFPPDAGSGLPAQIGRLCREAGFEPRIVQTAREATTQIGLVAAGLGIAVLPSPLECVRIPRVRYLPIADPGADFPLALAVPQRPLSPVQEAFVGLLAELRAGGGGR